MEGRAASLVKPRTVDAAMSPDFLLAQRPRRPRPGLRLHLDPPAGAVRAGGRVRFQLRVLNRGREAQDVLLAVEPPGDGWLAKLPVRSLRVEARSASIVVLRVDAPADAPLGTRATFQVSAAGSARPDRSAL